MELSIHGARILRTFENVPVFGTVQITQTLAVSWLVMIIVSSLAVWLGAGLRVTGISRKQAVAELAYTFLVKFIQENMGGSFERYIPLLGTIFITSVVSNLISLLGIWSPTADLMTVLAWALVVYVLILYHKIKAAGLRGYLKGLTKPFFVLLPINVMSELFTPVSLACRHFGNILSGTVITALVYAALTSASNVVFGSLGSSIYAALAVLGLGLSLLVPGYLKRKKRFWIPGSILAALGVLAVITNLGVNYPWLTVGIPAIPSLYFDWFGGCIQAFIFCTLSALFIRQAAAD